MTGIIGYNIILYYALYYTSPLNAALVNSINPSFIAIVSAFYLKERITKYHVFGIMISFLGVWIVLTKGNWDKIITIITREYWSKLYKSRENTLRLLPDNQDAQSVLLF